MSPDRLNGILDFLRGAEAIKDTLRFAFTTKGRHESTAEHTWRLCLMIMLFEKDYPHLDMSKVMKICIIHGTGMSLNV